MMIAPGELDIKSPLDLCHKSSAKCVKNPLPDFVALLHIFKISHELRGDARLLE